MLSETKKHKITKFESFNITNVYKERWGKKKCKLNQLFIRDYKKQESNFKLGLRWSVKKKKKFILYIFFVMM